MGGKYVFFVGLSGIVVNVMENTIRQKRLAFVGYVKKTFAPKVVYYPASGHDRLVKDGFAPTPVIHLSLPEDEPGYVSELGPGINILGNIAASPLAATSVDAIWIKFGGNFLFTAAALHDLNRVLVPGGIVVIEGINIFQRDKWAERKQFFSHYKTLALPNEFLEGQVCYAIGKQDEDLLDYRFVGSNEALMAYVVAHPEYSGQELVFDYAIFQKQGA